MPAADHAWFPGVESRIDHTSYCLVNRSGSWTSYDSTTVRPCRTDFDYTITTYNTLGFRTFIRMAEPRR